MAQPTPAQIAHIEQHIDLFHAHAGTDRTPEEYLREYAYYKDGDIYERLCSDLGLTPIQDHEPEKGQTNMGLSTDDIELALSLGVDPDDSGPLSNERRQELEAQLAGASEAETEHDAAVSGAIGQDAIAAAAEQIMAKLAAAGAGAPAAPQQGGVEALLQSIDPRDSEAHLAILQFLIDNKRMQVIGSLAGGGYLFHYQEPKGTSMEGYMPGGTKGGRMVDQALDKAKASGATAAKRGMCDKCYSVVVQHDDGSVTTDDEAANTACSSGGTHNFNA